MMMSDEEWARYVEEQDRLAAETIKREKEEYRWRNFPSMVENMWEEDGLTDKSFLRHSFKDDDRSNEKISNLCQKYCDNWDKMLENNVGILLYGSVGAGKSFFSSCIANQILEKRIATVCATALTRLLTSMELSKNRLEVLDRLNLYRLLILDDFGSERLTGFAQEQIFAIVDSRYRAQLPVIITTNLALKELENPENLSDARLFDRILSMCPIRVHVPGSSKRKAEAERRTQLVRELLR